MLNNFVYLQRENRNNSTNRICQIGIIKKKNKGCFFNQINIVIDWKQISRLIINIIKKVKVSRPKIGLHKK